MNKELLDKIKKEAAYITALFALALIIFKLVFYEEKFVTVLRTLFSFFWLFVLPGFSLMYYWSNLEFIERFIAGIAVSLAIIGILSYYLGLIGLHVKYHAVILPIIILIGGIAIILAKKPAA